MSNAERLAAIYREYQTLDSTKDSARVLEILSEAATLIDRTAEPKKWGIYRLMYAQAAESVDAAAAISAYRESIPVWDPEKDHNPLVSCHYGLGTLLFARVTNSSDVEEPIPHLEFAADDFPYECVSMLSLLYAIRQLGDPLENWKKRTHFLEITIAHLSPVDSTAAWASRRNDLAIAWTQEPGGDFATTMERRIENHIETLAHLNPNQNPAAQGVFIQTCMNLSEAYGARVAGDRAENQASAVRYAKLGAEAATEEVSADVRAQASLAFGRALLAQRAGQKEGDRRTLLYDALARFQQAGSLFDWSVLPVLASTVERFQASVYAELVELGELDRLEDMMAAAMSSYSHLEHDGDASGRRTVMLIAAETLIKVKQFARAIPCLEKAAAAGESALMQATSRAGRLERIWDLQDSWALLAYCHLETGSIAEAVEALDRGKARLWQTAAIPVTAEQIRTLIPTGGALLFPVFAGPRGAVAIATEAGWDVAWLENLGKAQLRSVVLGDGTMPTSESLMSLTGWVLLYATRHVNAARWTEQIESIGDLLYRDLWQCLQEHLDKLGGARQTELVWFPQGVSCVLPIHSARYQARDGLHYITEDYALRYAPAAAMLLSAPPGKHTGASLIVTNPQSNLPYTELELEWVKQYMGERDTVVLKTTDATRDAVLARLPTAEVFHFSGHAFFRIDDPFQSCLGLAPPDILSLEDLQPLLLQNPPRMVVLSACQTGMAQVTTRADEALGFRSMLLGQGVRTVLATLWPVDDLASALLVGQFYRFWQEEQQPPAQALRSAQNWLRTATAGGISDLLRPLKKVAGPVGALAAAARTQLFQKDPESRPMLTHSFGRRLCWRVNHCHNSLEGPTCHRT
jgi:CHAT domain-containing protein